MPLQDLTDAQQRVIEDMRAQARVLEARGGAGDKAASEAILAKIADLQSRLDGLKARQQAAEDGGPIRAGRRPNLMMILIILAAAALVAVPLARLLGLIN